MALASSNAETLSVLKTLMLYRFGLIKFELLLSFLLQVRWKKKTQPNKHSINSMSGASKS
jgi:hypothetical protein